MIAVDTNVLVYAVSAEDPHHAPSRALVGAVAKGVVPAALFPQNLLEFYTVVTDSKRMTRTLTPQEALSELSNLTVLFQVLYPGERSLDYLSELLGSGRIRGSSVFDAFIVAQMQDAGIGTICTYNTRDFSSYPVRSVTPEEVLEGLGVSPDGPGLVQDRPETK